MLLNFIEWVDQIYYKQHVEIKIWEVYILLFYMGVLNQNILESP
jgi:hypothetical protein